MKMALLLLALASCVHAAAGDLCHAGDAFCSGTTQALVCTAGVLKPFGCHGPKGCTVTDSRAVLCDQSAGALPGDICFPQYEGKGQCTALPGAYLQCLHGAWVENLCPPGKFCVDGGGSMTCK